MLISKVLVSPHTSHSPRSALPKASSERLRGLFTVQRAWMPFVLSVLMALAVTAPTVVQSVQAQATTGFRIYLTNLLPALESDDRWACNSDPDVATVKPRPKLSSMTVTMRRMHSLLT